MNYPITEPVAFSFKCPGCDKGYTTNVPRHGAPFWHRCKVEGCGWTLTVQTDPAGISAGFTAPIAKRPRLEIVK